MEETLQELQIRYEEKSLKAAEFAKKAAELTHTVITADKKSKKALDAIGTHDKATMWNTLQEYLWEYSNFINSTSLITGLCLYKVDHKFYEQVTVEDIEKQLHIITGYIYAREAANSAAKATFKSCLKSLMKKSGKFTYAELALL